jgi:hypothetical protein
MDAVTEPQINLVDVICVVDHKPPPWICWHRAPTISMAKLNENANGAEFCWLKILPVPLLSKIISLLFTTQSQAVCLTSKLDPILFATIQRIPATNLQE